MESGPGNPAIADSVSDEFLKSANILATPKRLPSLTGLRGAAALWVVFFHLFPLLGRLFHANLDLLWVREGYLGVDVFFILSGYILFHVYASDFKRYGIREHIQFLTIRLARIYPLHFAVMLCFALAVWLVPGLAAQNTFPRYSVRAFLIAMALLQNCYRYPLIWNSPAWSLSAEWFAYVLFPGLLIVVRSVRVAWHAMAAALLSLAGLALLFIAFGHSLNAQGKAGFLRLAAEFPAGMLIRRAQSLGVPARFPWRWLNPAATLLLGATLFYRSTVPLSVPLFGILIFSLSSSEGQMDRLFKSRIMMFLGEISYSMYLVQALLFELATWYINRYAPVGSNAWAMAALLITALLFAPLLSWWAIERPGRAAGRRLAARLRS